jgi:hypothetical protein
MYSNFQEEGCNFFLKNMGFLEELQPWEQKPEVLTKYQRSVNNFNIYQYIRDLTQVTGD